MLVVHQSLLSAINNKHEEAILNIRVFSHEGVEDHLQLSISTGKESTRKLKEKHFPTDQVRKHPFKYKSTANTEKLILSVVLDPPQSTDPLPSQTGLSSSWLPGPYS